MSSFNRISIKSKLQLMLLMISLGSILVIGYLGWSWAKNALKETLFNQLTSVRSSKALPNRILLQKSAQSCRDAC